MNPVHILTPYFLLICLDLILICNFGFRGSAALHGAVIPAFLGTLRVNEAESSMFIRNVSVYKNT
jgi:hypothetical protein